MDLFAEIEDLNSLFCGEKGNEINCGNGFEDLQNKYTNLHENYSKEVDNTKKVGKSLAKCLKFYAKLCKKYEAQQKLINELELAIKEKNSAIEECQKNNEKMTGLIRVYEAERTSFRGPGVHELKKDKELLLDICCNLMAEAVVGSDATRNLGKLLLRKFRKDLSDEKISVIKQRMIKNEDRWEIVPPDLLDFTSTKMEFKSEEKYSKELKKDIEEELPKESENTPMEVGIIEDDEEEEEDMKEVPEKLDVPKDLDSLEKEKQPPEGGCTLCAKELASLPMLEETVDVLQLVRDFSKNSPAIPVVTPPLEKLVEPIACDEPVSKSVFDINVSNDSFASDCSYTDTAISFGTKEKHSPSKDKDSVDLEKEVNRILGEMTIPRLLSPIHFIEEEKIVPVVSETSKGCELTLPEKRRLERDSGSGESHFKSSAPKKLKTSGPLDSIISAMSIQDEIFKSNGCVTKESNIRCTRSSTKAKGMRKSDEDRGSTKENSFVQKNKQQADERAVRKGLSEFVATPITSKEDADKNVRHCLEILSNKPAELIAKCIVAIVLENVDEPVEVLERPAPPLTKTQHRLCVLLSVFQKLDPRSEKIPPLILSMISKKLFPDNFFWPDDSVESATRFYAALCRSRNDTKHLWKFCINAMTKMRQRCPVAVFAILQTWPDVLHDASTLKNILPLTVVNLFLHMPKTEGLRNLNQKRKLMALKHLLMNFYQFKVEDTIENYTKRVYDAVLKDEVGAEKSFVMLVKCRDADWAVKNVVPVLKGAVLDWGHGKVDDMAAQRILSVIKEICPVLSEAKDGNGARVKEMVASLCGILTLSSKSHELELQVVEVLLQLKQHGEARKAISEWVPKKTIDNVLRNEIINMSAENVLREWKQNRGREQKTSPTRRKLKKKIIKGKKKRKGKKRKKSNPNTSCVSS